MNTLKQKTFDALRKSEGFFKTDMVYLSKGGFWLGIGQVISALIALASSLFFANLVSKEIYGNYKFIISATSILASLSLTGMGTIVTQGVAQGAEGILKSAVKTTFKWGAVIVAVALAISLYYFTQGNTVLGLAMLFAGIALPISQAFTLYGNYLMGKKDFKRVTLYATASQFLTTATLIVVAITTQSIIAMVFVYFALNTVTTVWAYRHTVKLFHINRNQDHTLIPYGKHLSVMGAFGTLANQLDKILVFHYLGAIQLAVYAFSQAIPDQAKGVLKSLFGIALPKYADLAPEKLRASVVKKSIQLTLFTIFAVGVYLGLAPFIFQTLFPKYLEAMFYSQIYMLGLITIPGITLFGIYFQLKKATRKLYELNVVSTVSTLLITFILVYKHGLMGAVVANGASWLVMLLVHWFYFMKEKDRGDTIQLSA